MGASLSATEPNRLAVAAISHVVHCKFLLVFKKGLSCVHKVIVGSRQWSMACDQDRRLAAKLKIKFKLRILTRDELRGWWTIRTNIVDRDVYVKFKDEVYGAADDSEEQLITLNKFNEALALVRIHPKDKEVFDRLFVLFDRAGDGVVCSREVIVGCSILVKMPPRKKLQFAFELYDEPGEGKLAKDDIAQVLRWLSKTSAFFGDKQPTADAMNSLVDRVFNKIASEEPEDTSYAIYADPMLDHPAFTDYVDQVEDSTRLQNEPID